MATQSCLSVSIISNHTEPACGAEPQGGWDTPFHIFQKDCDSLKTSFFSPLVLLPFPPCQSLLVWVLFFLLCSPLPSFVLLLFSFLLSKTSLQFSLTSHRSFCSLTSPCFQFLSCFLAITRPVLHVSSTLNAASFFFILSFCSL